METEKFKKETEKLEMETVFYKMLFINRTSATNRHQCKTAIDESEGPRLNDVKI